jgi:UPF0271 protein
LMGFGRRVMLLNPEELRDLMIYQIGAVAALIEAEGLRCEHVKPHGVLYSMLYEKALAEAFADAVEAVDRSMSWICEDSSATAEVARGRGIKVVTEFTADRAYDANGKLIITRLPEAVDPKFAVSQARQVLESGGITTTAGTIFPVKAEIICMHSDTPNSPEVAQALCSYLDSVS